MKLKAISYYLKEGIPLLALTLESENEEVKEAYAFELYKLGGQVGPSMLSVVVGLEDKVNIVKCYLSNNKGKELINFLKDEIERFKQNLEFIYLVEVVKTKKYVLGNLISFGHFAEQVVLLKVKEN